MYLSLVWRASIRGSGTLRLAAAAVPVVVNKLRKKVNLLRNRSFT
jgi:hypothetical protein